MDESPLEFEQTPERPGTPDAAAEPGAKRRGAGRDALDDLDDRSKRRLASVLGALGQLFTVSGIVTLLFVVYQLWGTGVQEAQAQQSLRGDFAERLAQVSGLTEPVTVANGPKAPEESADDAASDPSEQGNVGSDDEGAASLVGSASNSASNSSTAGVGAAGTSGSLSPELRALLFPEGGEEIARIEIPSIDVDKIVVEGVSVEDLRKGPGRYKRSVLPGEPGNTAFAGHRTTYGAPFHNIDNLIPGDEILVTSLLGEFTYRVIGQTEKNRVGFCVDEGYRPSEADLAKAVSLQEARYESERNATTTTTTTTTIPAELPNNFAVGAIDGITYFATTDVDAELSRLAQIEAEANAADEELVVVASEGVGRGAFDDIVDQPAEFGHFIVAPSDTCVLDDWGDNRITLTACHPKYSARQRIIVVAELVGEPVAPVSRPTTGAGEGLGADEGVETDQGGADQRVSTNAEADDAGSAEPASGDETQPGSTDGTADEPDDDREDSEPASTVAFNGDDFDAGLGWDTSALAPALGWGLVTMLFYMATTTAARRWKRWPSWVIGAVPVAWFLFRSFEQFDRLLPAY